GWRIRSCNGRRATRPPTVRPEAPMAVGPIIPPGLEWAYTFAVGQQWPQGNEDSLRALAQVWRDADKSIHDIVDEGNGAARQVTLSIQGPSADEFIAHWNEWTNGD